MIMKLTFDINDDLAARFEMALQLTGESRDTVVESLMKAYIVQSFSRAESAYQSETLGSDADKNHAKALHKIPKWASKPMVIPSKIIRAYLQLLDENGSVTYPELLLRCSDKENHPDEFVGTFANNFAQMKFDDEKSHGKVFEVIGNQKIILWKNVEGEIMAQENNFKTPKYYSTVVGYRNRYKQVNLGKTQKPGTDNGQWFYRMRCDDCLYEYVANGSDIHLKKCPACQGGADSGAK